MADVFSKRKRSRIMSRIRSSGSRPERLLRRLVREASGRRIRLNDSGLPGSPDVVVPSLRLAIFMEGCFWHNCPRHGRIPKSNVKFWREKITRNVRRDRRNRKALASLGWTVWRIWEHDLRPELSRRALRNLRRRFRRFDGRRVPPRT